MDNYFYVNIHNEKENSTKEFNGKIESGTKFDAFLFNCVNIRGEVKIKKPFKLSTFDFEFNNEKDFNDIINWIKKHGEVL